MPRTPAERDAIDPTVWGTPEMRSALATRDVATVYRHLQRAGVSQRRIAALTGQSQSEISEILGGRKVLAYDLLIRIADGLGVPRGWMGLAYDDATALSLGWSATASVNGHHREVNRRALLALGTAALATPLTSLPVGPAQSTPTPILHDIASRLGAVMLPIGRTTSAEPRTVTSLTEDVKRAWVLRQRAQYESLGNLLVTLIRDLDSAALSATNEQQEILTLSVHTYNAASSLLKRLGDSALALRAADRALRAAKALDDPLLIAAAAYRLANVLLSANRLADTRSVALQAATAIEPGQMETARSLSLWGGLLLTAAVAAARARDESSAWELIGEARTAARLLGADYADMYSIFGPTNVAIHAVQLAVEMDDGRGAVQRAQRVKVDDLPAALLERRAQFLVDLAHGHVLERDHGEALATLLHAEQTAPQEVRLSGDARGLVQQLLHEKAGAASELRQLANRVGISA